MSNTMNKLITAVSACLTESEVIVLQHAAALAAVAGLVHVVATIARAL